MCISEAHGSRRRWLDHVTESILHSIVNVFVKNNTCSDHFPLISECNNVTFV